MKDDLPGVSVIGSASIEVEPDSAIITASVSNVDEKPQEAFTRARTIAADVYAFLERQSDTNFSSSRISLAREHKYVEREHKFVGYRATMGFRVTCRVLDNLEALVTGLISAGATELGSVQFVASKLVRITDDVRRKAIHDARRRALLYCEEEGVLLGQVLRIRETNLAHSESSRAGAVLSAGAGKSIEPDSVKVGALVEVTYAIAQTRVRKRAAK